MKFQDITGRVGPLFPAKKPEIPMHSFERAAYLFWQGFYQGLMRRGLTHEQAVAELQSKGTRWMFDGNGDALVKFGEKFAKDYQPCVTPAKA